jgi:peptidoglycan/xylan/chitin deacetylase (PgdA/CDA1 family)
LNFFRAPFFLPWLYPSLIWRIPSTEKEIYLTFDDGPVPGPTDFVLETLKKYNCKATFFCIGDNVRKQPDVFKRVVDSGHAIGNHTFNHLKGWSTPTTEYVRNVKRFDEQLKIENCDFEN